MGKWPLSSHETLMVFALALAAIAAINRIPQLAAVVKG